MAYFKFLFVQSRVPLYLPSGDTELKVGTRVLGGKRRGVRKWRRREKVKVLLDSDVLSKLEIELKSN